MNKKVVIIGAGGHAKVVADIIIKSGDKVIGYLDDKDATFFPDINIIGKICDIEKYIHIAEFIIAIGENSIRENISNIYDCKWYTAIHPTAAIGQNVYIGVGTVIMANVVINPSTKIGIHCIINTGAVIEHECIINNYVHISPNASLGGTTSIGYATHIGIGSIVNNNIAICNNCIIGAGAVVINNITEAGTYVGVPCKKIK